MYRMLLAPSARLARAARSISQVGASNHVFDQFTRGEVDALEVDYSP